MSEMINAVEGNIDAVFCDQGFEIAEQPFNKTYKYLKVF